MKKATEIKKRRAGGVTPMLYADVQKRIVVVRRQSVILDADVAALYGVETKRVNEAVRNNRDKFPADYMISLTDEEFEDLRSKLSTANPMCPTAKSAPNRAMLPRRSRRRAFTCLRPSSKVAEQSRRRSL